MRRVAVYAGTRNVYGQMVIAAKSLTSHTRMDRVWCLIEDDVFPEALPDVIRCVNVSGQEFFPKDGPNYDSEWTYMTLMRLVLPRVLPAEEQRCLWLDTDTIVEQDIGELFDMPMRGNYVAMVEEPVRSRYPFRYHNAGVMLMDLDALRMDGIWQKWVKLVNRQKMSAPDQDAVNLICQGEILTIGPEWNNAGHITQNSADTKIRHYAGCLKPRGERVFREYEQAEWIVKTEGGSAAGQDGGTEDASED